MISPRSTEHPHGTQDNPHGTHDIPHSTEHPHGTQDIPHGTEHPHAGTEHPPRYCTHIIQGAHGKNYSGSPLRRNSYKKLLGSTFK